MFLGLFYMNMFVVHLTLYYYVSSQIKATHYNNNDKIYVSIELISVIDGEEFPFDHAAVFPIVNVQIFYWVETYRFETYEREDK